jgi:hypothetical protein
MQRTQIQLTPAQLRAIRMLAAQQGRSVAEVVRESVDLYVNTTKSADDLQAAREQAKRAAGRFASGSRDGSARHDDHLAEAFRQ